MSLSKETNNKQITKKKIYAIIIRYFFKGFYTNCFLLLCELFNTSFVVNGFWEKNWYLFINKLFLISVLFYD